MWTLLLARQADPAGTYIDRRQLDGGQIKVGRSARTCDWVLADDNGHVSREHCTIMASGLDLFVVDTSTNGVALNAPGQRIAPHQPVSIRLRDRLLIGDYAIEVGNDASAGMGMAAAAPPSLALPAAGLSQRDPWFEGPADPVWGDPRDDVHDFLSDAMHDFLGVPSARAAEPAWGGPLGDAFAKPILAMPSAPPADFGIPEDWAAPAASPRPAADPFADMARAGDPFAAPPPRAADPFAGLQPLGAAGDPFAGLPPLGGDSFGEASADPFAMPAPVAASADPFAGFGSSSVAAPAPISAIPPPTAPEGAWAAFCEGAGMDPADLRAAPDAMRRLGVLYRQVVLGLSDLIQDRAAFKDEFRVERTQLGIGRNNPLKHLPPLDSAKLLLGDPLPGFMASDEAVRAAFEDVKRHQLAMLAGVQAAMSAVFDRLSPQEVERIMAKAQADKGWASLRRGIDPWTVYQTVFEALRRDATANANSVMSVAFRDGYEKFLRA